MSLKVVCISDTHCQLGDGVIGGLPVPDGDVLIHAGDATLHGTSMELLEFAEGLAELPHKHKIFVPGNHDFICEDDPGPARNILYGVIPDLNILENRSIEIDGITFYGCPVNSNIPGWAYYKEPHIAEAIYSNIPEGDVLITHEPPYEIGDWVEVKKDHEPSHHIGSIPLRNAVFRGNYRYHIYGHIHESYGARNFKDINFINASNLNRQYEAVNKPIIFHIGE